MIAGVVLAGGRSTRMGRDKATLELGGERLVDRVVEAVRAALAAAGERSPRVVVAGDVPGHECVADAVPGLGPVAGLGAAAARLPGAEWLLAVPVDLPALTPAALAPLLATRGARAAVAHEDHALPALLRAGRPLDEALAAVLAAPRAGDRSVLRLLDLLDVEWIPLDPRHAPALANANTPAELRAALGGEGGRPCT
jgi:molybdopterin-guanine dinucleotide biosynthesis protein A